MPKILKNTPVRIGTIVLLVVLVAVGGYFVLENNNLFGKQQKELTVEQKAETFTPWYSKMEEHKANMEASWKRAEEVMALYGQGQMSQYRAYVELGNIGENLKKISSAIGRNDPPKKMSQEDRAMLDEAMRRLGKTAHTFGSTALGAAEIVDMGKGRGTPEDFAPVGLLVQQSKEDLQEYETIITTMKARCGLGEAPFGSAPVVSAVDPAKAEESEEFFNRGLKLYEQENYREAVVDFDKAIAANPANFKIYTAKGMALCFEGDYQGGLVLIQKTLAMNPGYVPACYDMAMAHKLQNNYDQSLYWFEKTIQGDPENTWSYYGIATIHADRGNTQESLKYLKKAIELDQGVKAVARKQDHFAKMRSLPEFQALTR
ncbi:MAG: ycf3 [Firmicutes bacterium]|nr:ycf3 [Bacillota bacterium]